MRWIHCFFISSFISLAQISGEKVDPFLGLVEAQTVVWENNRAAVIGEIDTLYLKKLEETKTKLVKLGKLTEARAYENAKTSKEKSDNDPPSLVKIREVRVALIAKETKEIDQKYWRNLQSIKKQFEAKGDLEGAEFVETEMKRVMGIIRSQSEVILPKKTDPLRPAMKDSEGKKGNANVIPPTKIDVNQSAMRDVKGNKESDEVIIEIVSKSSPEFKKYLDTDPPKYNGYSKIRTFNEGPNVSYLGVENTADEAEGEWRNKGMLFLKFPRPIHLKKARIKLLAKAWDSDSPNFKGIGKGKGSFKVTSNIMGSATFYSLENRTEGADSFIEGEISEESIYGKFLYIRIEMISEHIPKDAAYSAAQFAWEDKSNKDPLPFLKLTFYNDE